jgi:hypothetical protein
MGVIIEIRWTAGEEVKIMKKALKKSSAAKTVVRKRMKAPLRETLTEAYEVRAFRDELEESRPTEFGFPSVPHAEPGELQNVKSSIKGHGEQTVIPDDCQYGDNDLCDVDS